MLWTHHTFCSASIFRDLMGKLPIRLLLQLPQVRSCPSQPPVTSLSNRQCLPLPSNHHVACRFELPAWNSTSSFPRVHCSNENHAEPSHRDTWLHETKCKQTPGIKWNMDKLKYKTAKLKYLQQYLKHLSKPFKVLNRQLENKWITNKIKKNSYRTFTSERVVEVQQTVPLNIDTEKLFCLGLSGMNLWSTSNTWVTTWELQREKLTQGKASPSTYFGRWSLSAAQGQIYSIARDRMSVLSPSHCRRK